MPGPVALLAIGVIALFFVVFLLGLCDAASQEAPKPDFVLWEEEIHGSRPRR